MRVQSCRGYFQLRVVRAPGTDASTARSRSSARWSSQGHQHLSSRPKATATSLRHYAQHVAAVSCSSSSSSSSRPPVPPIPPPPTGTSGTSPASLEMAFCSTTSSGLEVQSVTTLRGSNYHGDGLSAGAGTSSSTVFPQQSEQQLSSRNTALNGGPDPGTGWLSAENGRAVGIEVESSATETNIQGLKKARFNISPHGELRTPPTLPLERAPLGGGQKNVVLDDSSCSHQHASERASPSATPSLLSSEAKAEVGFLHSLRARAPLLFTDADQHREIDLARQRVNSETSRGSPKNAAAVSSRIISSASEQGDAPTAQREETNTVPVNDAIATSNEDTQTAAAPLETASSFPAQLLFADQASAPWRTRVNIDHLSDRLLERDRSLLPDLEQYTRKQRWLVTTKALLEERCGGTLHAFGSCANGFWMRGSDVDACLLVPGCNVKEAQVSKLKLVGALLRAANAGKVLVVPAKVPVAKVTNLDGSDAGDISINNSVAIDNSNFVRTLAMFDPRVRHVGRVVKSWAMQRKINQRAEGTLSTYTIMLQLFYLVQKCHRVVPLYRELVSDQDRPKSRVDGAPIVELKGRSDFKADEFDQTTSVGELFINFFLVFGSSGFSAENGLGRTILDGDVEENDEGTLIMRCPISKANVNPMSSETWRILWTEFARARELLMEGKFDEVFLPADICPLRKHKSAVRKQKAVAEQNMSNEENAVSCSSEDEESSRKPKANNGTESGSSKNDEECPEEKDIQTTPVAASTAPAAAETTNENVAVGIGNEKQTVVGQTESDISGADQSAQMADEGSLHVSRTGIDNDQGKQAAMHQ
ncbi:unnamed protein product [Amoebophrya sp. A120]|nr:unnamed protein product [Amoebophrya sp. A120]|eukprot:GSA120T00002926001.1